MKAEVPYRIALALLLAGLVAHRACFLRRHPRALARLPEAAPPRVTGALIPWLGTVALIATITYVVRPQALSWAALPLPAWARWLGLVLGVAGLLLVDSAQRALGVQWSVSPRLIEGHQLVRVGPYRWVRHPIYTALLMVLGSPLLIAANWVVGGTCLGVTLLDVSWRAQREEALLQARFGSGYADYMAATGRFLPRWWRSGSAASGPTPP